MRQRQLHTLPHETVQEMGQIAECIAQIKAFELEGLFALKRQKLTNQRGGAVGVLADLDKVCVVTITLIVV